MVEPLSTYKSYTKSSNRICIREKEQGLFFAEPEENFVPHTLVDKTERLKVNRMLGDKTKTNNFKFERLLKFKL